VFVLVAGADVDVGLVFIPMLINVVVVLLVLIVYES
jgi:hypothetical protein